MELTHKVIVTILAIELLTYLAIVLRRDFYEKLSKKGVNVYPFMFLIDLGKVPRLAQPVRSKRVIYVMLMVTLGNFIFLLYMFYRALTPYVVTFVRSLISGTTTVSSPFIPIVPGLTVSVSQFIYILLALSIGMALHEVFHAIAAYINGWRVESWGLGIFLIFPLAYVKPSEEDYREASLKSKAVVLTSGVLANTIVFIIAMLLLPMLMAQVSSAVVIVSITNEPEAPAYKAHLPYPSILISINGTKISSVNDLRQLLIKHINESVTYVVKIARAKFLGDTVSQASNVSTYILAKPKGVWRLGILVTEMPLSTTSPLILGLTRFTYWLYIVNLSLAVINAAPLYITDGGRLISEFLGRLKLGVVNHVVQGITAFFVAIFLIVGLLRFL